MSTTFFKIFIKSVIISSNYPAYCVFVPAGYLIYFSGSFTFFIKFNDNFPPIVFWFFSPSKSTASI